MQNEQLKVEVQKGLADKMAMLRSRIANGEHIERVDKIQVAVLADSPNVITGFGNVCREILSHLNDTGLYAFDIVGINYDGSPHDLPFRIFPAVNGLVADQMYREPYGRQRFLDMIGEGRFDLVWVLQDSFIVSEELAMRIKENNDALPIHQKYSFMFYFPIDSVPRKKWIDESALLADFPVVYTDYGYQEVMKLYEVNEDTKLTPEFVAANKKQGEDMRNKLQVIYHGVNTTDFFPIEDVERIKELKERTWNTKKDKFVFMNVNRNQPRKDLYHTLQAFKILLDRRRAKGKDDVYLYLHCNVFDNNINLIEISKQMDLVHGEEFAFPDPKMFGPAQGFPTNMLNEMYNAADAVVTTTLGEGWGLSVTEGMAVKRPVIAPDHTSLTEMLGRIPDTNNAERGFLVKTSGSFVQQNDNARIRPLVDPVAMADAMEFVMDNREAIQPMVESAYQWAKSLMWAGERVGKKWEKVFEDAYTDSRLKRMAAINTAIAQQQDEDGLGRNDICPICNTKRKKCMHGK